MGGLKKSWKWVVSNIWTLLLALSLTTTAVSAGMLIRAQYQKWRANKLFEELASIANSPLKNKKLTIEEIIAPPETQAAALPTEETAVPPAQQETEVDYFTWKKQQYYEQYGIIVPGKDIDFDMLHETITPDIYGWIYIPETTIDYPLLRHPTDNAYYLEHNLDGSTGYPGCIYTENYNSMDFTDRHTAIYGHNMRDRTMFSDLHLYEKNEKFMEDNPYVYIYTEDNIFVYRVFAAYETDNTHPVLGYDVSTDEAFLEYLDSIVEKASQVGAVVGIGREFEASDRLLTLSTCGMKVAQPLIRYLVQGIYLKVE